MFNKILVFLFCFFTTYVVGQENEITLPSVDVKLGSYGSPYFSIYIDKIGNVFFEKDKIDINEVSQRLYEGYHDSDYPYGPSSLMPYSVHIFADKEAKFSVIDSVRTEISKTSASKYLIYRSNLKQENTYDIKGIKIKSPMSFYRLSPPLIMITKKHKRELDSINKIEQSENPEIISLDKALNTLSMGLIASSIERAIYSIQQDVIDEALLSKKYKCINVTNQNIISDRSVYFNDIEKMKNVVNENDIVFLDYDKNLKYGEYIHFIEKFQKINPNFKNSVYKANIIELSYQIQSLHKKAKIKLCN